MSTNILDSLNWNFTAPSSIKVYFVPGGHNWNDGDAITTSAWDSFEIQQAKKAFQNFSNVANVKFTFVNSIAEADFAMVEGSFSSPLGYWAPGGASVYGTPTLGGVGQGHLKGWGVFGGGDPSWSHANLAVGGYGYVTLIHEIGHGMGLAHPHDNGGGSAVMQGVTGPFGSYGSFNLNQGIYTTMSYNDGWRTSPHAARDITPSNYGYGWQGTLMALDIAALQQKYGANMNHRTGNDVYVLPSQNKPGTYYEAIWDAGGIDTIVHNGAGDAIIDLRAATIDYSDTGGGVVSYVKGIHGGFTIARHVVIENASGGSGNDVIRGNAAKNVLSGNGGNDRLEGAGGNDQLYGGNGNDSAYGGAGDDRLDGGAGNDKLYGGNANDLLYGGAGSDRLEGGAGNDRMLGGNDADTLYGGAGSDHLEGEAGNDKLYGGNNNDKLYGGAGADRLEGGAGHDRLYGGNNNDDGYGGAGNDRFYGGAGNDKFDGGNNDDLAYGGAGNDELEGGTGHDQLFGGNDDDIVYGGSGNDRLDGDAGNDRLYGGVGGDRLYGGTGSDQLYGGANNDRLFGGNNNDALYGGAGRDVINGGSGDDDLYGGTGDDQLFGGSGTDSAYFGGKRSDYTITQDGDRTIVAHKNGSGPQGTDTLIGVEFIVFGDQTIAI